MKRSALVIILSIMVAIAVSLAHVSCGGGGGGEAVSSDSSTSSGDSPVMLNGEPVRFISDPDDPLMLSATDQDGITYWLYAEKTPEATPTHFKVMKMTSSDQNNDPAEEVTMYFDQFQRPVRVVLPDLQGEITLEYLTESDAQVTVKAPDGSADTFILSNPYSQLQKSASRGLNQWCDSYAGFPSHQSQGWAGYIEACQDGPKPMVYIEKEIPGSDGMVERYFPEVSKFDEDGATITWAYAYSVNLTPDFEQWETYCQCMYWGSYVLIAGKAASGAYNKTVKLFFSLQSWVESFLKDLGGQTYEHTQTEHVKHQIEKRFGPGTYTFLQQLASAINSGVPPCSAKMYADTRKKALAPIRIVAEYNKQRKEGTFLPESAATNDDMPRFDYSASCCDQTTQAGSDAPETHIHELGTTKGVFTLDYNTYYIKDRIQVLYQGQVIYDSGCVGEINSVDLPFDGNAHTVTVKVIPNCQGTTGTAWYYTISCPE